METYEVTADTYTLVFNKLDINQTPPVWVATTETSVGEPKIVAGGTLCYKSKITGSQKLRTAYLPSWQWADLSIDKNEG